MKMEKIERDGREQHLFKYSLERTSISHEWILNTWHGWEFSYIYREIRSSHCFWYDSFASQLDRIVRKPNMKDSQTTENGYVEKERQKLYQHIVPLTKRNKIKPKLRSKELAAQIDITFITFTVYKKYIREIGKIMITACMTLGILHKWGNCSHNKDN